ncbi:MAG TPA: hypothetical protein EYN67_16855 [Flavobacteriales bacterium]|nr:hypothetical protein [Flavobacteriales bacterium]
MVQVCNNCEEGVNCDTYAVNPESGNRNQYGYKLSAAASIIGSKLTQMTLRLNNTASSTGTVGIYSKDTKVGTLDVSTLVPSYANYVISCSGSPTLAEGDVVWWENDVGRSGNINTKVIASGFANPENYVYVQNSTNSYGIAPSTPVTSNASNMCFSAAAASGGSTTFPPPPAYVRL